MVVSAWAVTAVSYCCMGFACFIYDLALQQDLGRVVDRKRSFQLGITWPIVLIIALIDDLRRSR